MKQELQTGINTGIGDYIRANCPTCLDMPPALYEDYFRSFLLENKVNIQILLNISKRHLICLNQTQFKLIFYLEFRSPWATELDFEMQHRNLFEKIGKSLKGKICNSTCIHVFFSLIYYFLLS